MASFDDVGQRADQTQRRKKNLVLVASSASLLVLVVVAAVATISYTQDDDDDNPGTRSSIRTTHTSVKSVEMLCASTDYKHTCESTVSKVIKNDTEDPKELLKATIAVAFDEVSKGFEHSSLLRSNDSRVRGAMEDCKELYEDSKGELKRTLEQIVDKGIENLPQQSAELQTWLSAVMSYQQTCIDGFPEGDLKDKMNEGMQTAKQVTSNALAIINAVANYLSMIFPGSRRLLAVPEESVEAALKKASFPPWISKEDRRMLKEKIFKLKPHVTVAQDGSGNYTTISEALGAIPKKREGRYVIFVKKGMYNETVEITKKMANVTMYGEGSRNTIITGNKNYVDGVRTFRTATFVVSGESFIGLAIGIRNTAGAAKHQAVAMRVSADKAIFMNCRIEGYQDTLYAHVKRQFYRGCIISGTIDFIFGDAAAVFQNCIIVVRRPLDTQQNIITAQGRIDARESTGFVLQHCRIRADKRLADPNLKPISSYLARPWKEYSKTIFLESEIGDFIHPEGYLPWNGTFALSTLYYAEHNNIGPGANVTGRVNWPGVHLINKREAKKYTVSNFLQGSTWIPATVPVQMGLFADYSE